MFETCKISLFWRKSWIGKDLCGVVIFVLGSCIRGHCMNAQTILEPLTRKKNQEVKNTVVNMLLL